MTGIYKITNPIGQVYIGQTTDVKRRFREYRNFLNSAKFQKKLYNSFIEFGFKDHKFEVILECYPVFLNEKERYYQEKYDVLSDKGLNLVYTKTALKRKRLSDASKRRIMESKTGNKSKSKIVLDLNTGVFYESAKEAAFFNSMGASTLRMMLCGLRKNTTSFTY